MRFLKEHILTKVFAVTFLTFLSLLVYLLVLLDCLTKGGGMENLYWVSIAQNGTNGKAPIEVRIGYFGTSSVLATFSSCGVPV
ncbi:hypothetical protein EJ02DRAFT_453871 [Clathrospora elynae]|uniref:Uncharacterized protein n=1 Tax=Clathrospora elynae TaxID=706981 RepID=A0A6A5STN2_9PLEO|nr:hypothetical protein EJ02DRAFT_453871 [Clathrospora elynae]